jgi:hypothetical protein
MPNKGSRHESICIKPIPYARTRNLIKLLKFIFNVLQTNCVHEDDLR